MSFHKTNNWLLAEPSGGITETSDKKKEKGKKGNNHKEERQCDA